MSAPPSTTFLTLPGYGGSGPRHWQTVWERLHPGFRRVEQRDFDQPDLHEWMASLEHAVAGTGAGAVLVAHSLACLLVAHWAGRTTRAIAGAMLVAPPDPARADFPDLLASFAPTPTARLPFPCLVVGSTNDPYAAPAFAPACAAKWGADFVSLGAAGHINADSDLGEWREGWGWLNRLVARGPGNSSCP